MTPEPSDAELLRVIRRLAPKGARLVRVGDAVWHAERSDGTRSPLAAAAAEALCRRGLVSADTAGGFVLAATGAAWLRRALANVDGAFAAQHQERVAAFTTDESGSHPVLVNADESPLSWLRRRRDRNGKPMIDAASFAAGERLRADFSRAQLMPRVTANWTAAVAGRGRDRGSSAEITEVAIAARRRVERAFEAVGPELGGLLLDFCCFLKGLEAMEAERQWPPRSAKVALKIALAMLARHYGLGRDARGRARSGGIVQWGTADYRPTLD